eukprot:TRINITY_DN34944_c0_g1_i1.p1 TRINITY_DN34944_c0_g1~~TRINITY_DN34944_c0_g1_i1.p1  ORF type:complete len:230 (+),score=29.98 TRINITY_DN34944_c0_g1_i1:101-790(+)
MATSPLRRNHTGCCQAEFNNWEPEEGSSTFSLQHLLQHMIKTNPANIQEMLEVPEGGDIKVWQYEHLRQFTLELNQLVIALTDVCTATTCPSMNVTDAWTFLCAAHKQPLECPAMDYMIHTLEATSALLNSNKHFPSRLSLSANSNKYFASLTRRLYRAFAHVFAHHREVYDQFERKTHLCERFVEFCTFFELCAEDTLNLIPRAELARSEDTRLNSSHIPLSRMPSSA